MASTKEVAVPEPLTSMVAGHPVTVTYRPFYDGSLIPTYTIPAALADRLKRIKDILDLEIDANARTTHATYRIVDPDGTEIASTELPWSLLPLYRDEMSFRHREATRPGLKAELEELSQRIEPLRACGLYRPEPMDAFAQCEKILSSGGWLDVAQVKLLLGQARKLINQLNGPFVEVVVRLLLDGTLYHTGVNHNNRVVRTRLTEIWIRSGGHEMMSRPTDEQMADIYRRRLTAAAVKTVSDVSRVDLTIRYEDFNDAEMQAEYAVMAEFNEDYTPIVLAPEQLTVRFGGKDHQYRITYRLAEVDGELVPRGIVRMPLNGYRRIEDEIPALDHDIELYFELTIQTGSAVDVVVHGAMGEQLTKRIGQYKGGQRRGAAVQGGDLYRRETMQPRVVPPWYDGAGKPHRWR